MQDKKKTEEVDAKGKEIQSLIDQRKVESEALKKILLAFGSKDQKDNIDLKPKK